MTAESVVEGLSVARFEVERACALLVSAAPELLEGCPGLLERACTVMEEFRPWLKAGRGDPAALAEARQLRLAVRRAAGLLESASDYYTRWNRILGAMTGGYTPHGHAAPVIRPGRISLAG